MKAPKEIAINIVVINCENETQDTMNEKLTDWVVSNGWMFGGSVEEITDHTKSDSEQGLVL